jgi:HK97 family phage portal protein
MAKEFKAVQFPDWLSEESIGYSGGSFFTSHSPSRSWNTINTTDMSYATVPLVFRALNLRCDALRRVPVYFYKNNAIIKKGYPYEDSLPFKDWLWMCEASELLAGASFTLRLKNQWEFEKGLKVLNPFTVMDESSWIDERNIRLYQQINAKKYPEGGKGYWTTDEVIYWKSYSPLNDVAPGVSAAGVALGNSQLLHYLTRFLSNFFEKGAMPVTFAMLPAGSSDEQRNEVQSYFKKMMTGVKNAFKVLAVKGEIKVEKLTPELASFEVQKLDTHAIDNIAWAFNVPKTLLTSDSATRATAETEYSNFLSQTISSRCDTYQSRMNKFLDSFNMRCEFAIEELPEMQVNETVRAGSLKNLVDSGVPLKTAMYILGYTLSDERQREMDDELLKPPPALPTPTLRQPSAIDPQPAQGQPASVQPMKSELEKWYRKSLKRLKDSKPAQVEFISDKIPSDLYGEIWKKLEVVKTEDELKSIFEEPNEQTVNTH